MATRKASKASTGGASKSAPVLPSDEVKAQIRSRVAEALEVGKEARYVMATTAHLVFSTPGAVGEHPGALYGSQGDYADVFGVSSPTVKQWRNLGLAISKGLTVDHDGWGDVSKVAARAEVREAIESARATKAGIASIVKVARAVKAEDKRKADAKAVEDAAKAATGGKRTGGTTDQTESPTVPVAPRSNLARLDQIETLLAALTRLSKAEKVRLAAIIRQAEDTYNGVPSVVEKVA